MLEFTNQEYQNIYSRVPRICVDLIATKNNHIILEKRDTGPYLGMWGLIGGGVKFGETLEEAIQRHALDGLGVLVGEITFVGIEEYLVTDDDWRHSVSLNYLVKTNKILNPRAKVFHSLPLNIIPQQAKLLKDRGFI